MEKGPVSQFITHQLPPFQRGGPDRRRERIRSPYRRRRQDDDYAGRCDEHGRAGHLARRDDPPGQGADYHLHRRQPRGGYHEPGGPLALQARAALPRPDASGRVEPARKSYEPRDGYLHSGGRGVPPPAGTYLQDMEGCRRQGRALSALRVHVQAAAQRRAGAVLRDRSEEQLDAGRLRERTSRSSFRAGRTARWATSSLLMSSRAS